MEKVNEAAVVGNIDKLYSEMDKVVSVINKAQNALLDVADELTDLILSANQIGGKIAQIVPSHLMPHISAITKMASTDLTAIIGVDQADPENSAPPGVGQASSIHGLKELIGNIPYRDIKPQSTNDVRNQISLQPNLTSGPQSAIHENTLEDFYKNALKEQAENYQYNDTILDFNKLKESEIFGTQYDEDMMEGLKMKLAKPIDTKILREKIRTRVDQDIFEDTGEELNENSPLDFSNLPRGVGDSQGMPMSFGALREGINMVDNT